MTRLLEIGDVVRGMLGTAAVVGVYELGRATGALPGTVPSSAAVAGSAIELLRIGEFWSAVADTSLGAFIGVALAAMVGVTLAVVLGTSRVVAGFLSVPIDVVRTVPAVALLPILVQAVGRGALSRSLVVGYAALWPILFTVLAGVRGVDRVALDTARSFALGPFARLARVTMPSVVPHVVTGVRIGLGIAVVVEVSAEILLPDPASPGVGGFIVLAGINGTDDAARLKIYAATVLAGVLGLLLNSLAATVERRFGRRFIGTGAS